MCENSSHQWELSCLSIDVSVNCYYQCRRAGEGESRYKLWPPPPMLHMFLLFSVVSDVIRWWFVVLTEVAASGHLACDALFCISLLVPLPVPPLLWGPKIFLIGARTRSRRPYYLCMCGGPREGFLWTRSLGWHGRWNIHSGQSSMCSWEWTSAVPLAHQLPSDRCDDTHSRLGNWTNCIRGVEL